ncbi:MAG: hypothetical protein ACO31I_09550 [Prochlorotrichaceae cyanobacterium]|jgi:hypothetical protein
MLFSPFPPSLAQRFESGLAGLALGCSAYQAVTTTSTDRYWNLLQQNILQVSHLDRPLTPPSTLEEGEWSVLCALPWIWVLLEDGVSQQDWLSQQPDPRIVLLFEGFEKLSSSFSVESGTPESSLTNSIPSRLSPFPAAQAVWQQAVQLTQNAATLAQGLEDWQRAPDLAESSADLKAIGIALWLTWRSDHLRLILAQAHHLVCYSDPFNPLLLCFAGVFGGFARAPFSWSQVSGGEIDRSWLRQSSEQLFRVWAGGWS